MTEKKPLGKILLKRKLVSREQLETALGEQQTGGTPLASHLIRKGLLNEQDALRALGEQFGVPAIDVTQIRLDTKHLSVLPRELAVAHRVLPVLVDEERLLIAIANPSEQHIIDELEFVTGKKVFVHVALQDQLARAINEAYAALEAGSALYEGPSVTSGALETTMPTIPPPSTVIEAARKQSVAEEIAPRSSDSWIVKDPPRETTRYTVGGIAEMIATIDNSPMSARVSGPPPEAKRGPGGEKRPRVLVVDDDADIRKLLKRMLEGKSYTVLEADRGQLALQMIKDDLPDLIILDAMLPELHGFDIARRMKDSEMYGSIPVIMVSAIYRGWRIAQDMKESCGIFEFIEKPFRMGDVLAKVEEALTYAVGRRSQLPQRNPEAINAEAQRCLDEAIQAYKLGNLDAALKSLTRGVQLDPLAYQLHFHLALLHAKRGSIYEGIQELERAIELHDKHFPSLKNLAILYERAGFRHKAAEMWERCAHVAPDPETKTQVKEHLMQLL